MQVALVLFAVKGYHATKVSDIVAESGVSQGTFYWYFKSKEEIALCIIEDGKGKLLKVVHQGYRKEIGTINDMVVSSKRLMISLLQFASDHRHLMILLFLKGQGASFPIRDAIYDTFTALEDAFAKNIKRAMELHMLHNTQPEQVRSQMLTSLVIGMISRWLFGPMREWDYVPEMSAEEVAEEIVQFEFFGLLGLGRMQ
ncbi:TetR family transcriptional regulator [Staphylococcus cohnii]|uniref:TetR family transcriptional regulator n=1 Tax=Staphylococcus cohnii TaxID=29382 RepID=A0A2T4LR99_9STAP|nr:TetR family transcriptional regulator [Staphylococcus cohnii]